MLFFPITTHRHPARRRVCMVGSSCSGIRSGGTWDRRHRQISSTRAEDATFGMWRSTPQLWSQLERTCDGGFMPHQFGGSSGQDAFPKSTGCCRSIVNYSMVRTALTELVQWVEMALTGMAALARALHLKQLGGKRVWRLQCVTHAYHHPAKKLIGMVGSSARGSRRLYAG